MGARVSKGEEEPAPAWEGGEKGGGCLSNEVHRLKACATRQAELGGW